MISRVVVRPKGKPARVVLVDRGHPSRTRRIARRMAEAGRPWGWIAAALRISRDQAERAAKANPI